MACSVLRKAASRAEVELRKVNLSWTRAEVEVGSETRAWAEAGVEAEAARAISGLGVDQRRAALGVEVGY